MSFLKAEWRKLVLVNYEIPAAVLESYIPAGTELDLWNGKCFVSLVGFMFKNTRILGIKIPFHINFEEVNLRFYVRRKEDGVWKRGVVFIKEIVPKAAISFVANTIYKEHYETLPMKHQWVNNGPNRTISYQWKKGNQWHQLKVQANLDAEKIEAGSDIEFITEHYWGYAKISDSKTNEYEVKHPKWEHYPVQSFTIDVNFEATYGKSFFLLNNLKPNSVMLAEGSKICVEGKKTLKMD